MHSKLVDNEKANVNIHVLQAAINRLKLGNQLKDGMNCPKTCC